MNLVAEALHGGGDLLIAEEGTEQEMHLLIEHHDLVKIVFSEGLVLLGEVVAELIDLIGTQASCETTNDPGLDCLP